MKVVSFNIGIKIDNTRAVINYLENTGADIICLQEAMRPLQASVFPLYRSAKDIIEALESEYGHYFFAPEWVADKTYGKDGSIRDFGGMVEQGKLVLSKYPILRGYNYFYFKSYELDRDRSRFYEAMTTAAQFRYAILI
jgi:endonuclease/exonuclease/phosphatase family metal-dependent hydrolase